MKSKMILISILLTLLVALLFIIGIISAKYVKIVDGDGVADVANIICQTSVSSVNSSINNVNPYCEVTVRNYDADNQLTQVGVEYTINILATNEELLPDYYCVDSNGNEVANSLDGEFNITGELGFTNMEEHEYTVYFINTGERNFTQNFRFVTKVIQKDLQA